MKILALGETLKELEEEQFFQQNCPAVFLANSRQAARAMELAGIVYDGEVSLSDVGICKLETQQDCLYGSLYIPKLLDVLGSRYRILFFINRQHIVIVDDDEFSLRLVRRIRRNKAHQGETRERFLYNFITQLLSGDLARLGQYEQHIMELEEAAMNGKTEGFENKIMPIRRELLTLRSYYDELMDFGMALEEDENHFFTRKQRTYFGTAADRADRLMRRTAQLLEYAQQVRDTYKAKVDEEQNKNMQFLTVLSTIFFPLTLITGWYGMNFENMPELQRGYPGVITLSLLVIGISILVFKKKKML